MNWRPEIDDGSGWGQNAQVFATKEEAEIMARDIYNRWMMARDWRATETEDPVNYRIETKENGEHVVIPAWGEKAA
jgi:hypothetical protein